MSPITMKLKILLPHGIFAEQSGVLRMVAETTIGAVGLWPRRLDCVAALTPGIFTYETEAEGEVFVAVDEGVLVKAGSEVRLSVRQALGGSSLAQLREQVEQEFLSRDEHEQNLRSVMTKLESGILRRLVSVKHG